MKTLKAIFFIHGLITLAAAIVLIVAPALIPKTIGIVLTAKEYLLSYFLGAAELSIAALSFYAIKIRDTQALKFISLSFIIFHLATGALEVYWGMVYPGTGIMMNVMLRVVISLLFYYFGVYRNSSIRR